VALEEPVLALLKLRVMKTIINFVLLISSLLYKRTICTWMSVNTE